MLLKAAELLRAAGELPVNLRIACDGEEEVGGHSIVEWLEADGRDADAAVVFDSGMVERDVPGFNIAVRGLCYFHVKVRTGLRDLHSGMYGGASLNAMHALLQALSAVLPRRGEAAGAVARRHRGAFAGGGRGLDAPAGRALPRSPRRDRARPIPLPARSSTCARGPSRPSTCTASRGLADPPEDGDPGRGGGERVDPARGRPGSGGHRARLRGAPAPVRTRGCRDRSRALVVRSARARARGRPCRPARARRVRGGARHPAAARPLRRRDSARLRARRAVALPPSSPASA